MAQFSKGRHEYHSAREFLMSREREQYTFEWWLQHITDHPNLISKRIREGIQDDEILKELKHQHIMAMFGERHISDPRGKYLKKIAQ